MSVFKRRRTNRAGKKMADNIWTVEFADHQNLTRRLSAFTDRSASVELERHLKRLVSLRMAGAGPDAESSRFLESCPDDVRNKLGEWGIITGQRAAAGKTVASLIGEWRASLESRCSAEHAREAPRRVGILFAVCRFTYLSEITAAGVEAELSRRRREENASVRTTNLWLSSAKSFLNWLKSRGQISGNPLSSLKPGNEAADRRYERRAFTIEELGGILAAAKAGPESHGMTGYERYLLYRVAVKTGYRWSEIKSFEKASLGFGGKQATLAVKAESAKNGLDDELPLPDDLAEELKQHLALHMSTARIFPGMGNKGAEMLRVDLEAAGVPHIDEYGRVADFHSFRHTLGTLGAKAGIPLATMQRIMRHSDPKLTANYYTHILIEDKADALAKLPAIEAVITESESQAKTGTDDMADIVKSADRPGDSFSANHEAKIRTYTDIEGRQNHPVLLFPKSEKIPVSQGETGTLSFGAGEALLVFIYFLYI